MCMRLVPGLMILHMVAGNCEDAFVNVEATLEKAIVKDYGFDGKTTVLLQPATVTLSLATQNTKEEIGEIYYALMDDDEGRHHDLPDSAFFHVKSGEKSREMVLTQRDAAQEKLKRKRMVEAEEAEFDHFVGITELINIRESQFQVMAKDAEKDLWKNMPSSDLYVVSVHQPGGKKKSCLQSAPIILKKPKGW